MIADRTFMLWLGVHLGHNADVWIACRRIEAEYLEDRCKRAQVCLIESNITRRLNANHS